MSIENMTLGKMDFQVEVKELCQADLRFYPENPRVYSILNNSEEEPSQDAIEEYMCRLDSVKQLKVSIESNGGVIDPLIVRTGDFTVLEGNSRLAAYRLLCEKDPVKWGKVKCKLLPADISDNAIFSLLGQYHIIGRKDWDPFEQAHYLYRRQQQTSSPIGCMAEELGISKQRAQTMIHNIQFMIQHNDLNKKHWSYYDEYLKSNSLRKYRETNPDIDDTIANSVKSEQIKEAADIRKLGAIAKVGDRQSKRVMQKISNGTIDLYDGYREIQETGKLDDVIKRLKTFRQVVNDKFFEKQISSSKETQQEAVFEIKKILQRLEAIKKRLISRLCNKEYRQLMWILV